MSDGAIKETVKMEEVTSEDTPNVDVAEVLNTSKESEGENVDAIKKYMEDQDKELNSKTDNAEPETETVTQENDLKPAETTNEVAEVVETDNKDDETEKLNVAEKESSEDTLAVASSVMDMILSDSVAKISEKKQGTGNSMPLSVGSKVEAKDFAEFWHPAEIVEVDYDEMEVLVHYENTFKRHDEWINVSSPRLRPKGSGAEPSAQTPESIPSTSSTTTEPIATKEDTEIKVEDKFKLTFAVGERCLARWRDNRRFIATVSQDLGDENYEIMFDDGVKWTCKISRLSKLKESKKDTLSIETTGLPPTSSTPSPVYGPGPSVEGIVQPIVPVATPNTHLFDPTRDYLGPKSERREMKRKLNIKEIFNIGQKKKKIEAPQKSKIEAPLKSKVEVPLKSKVEAPLKSKVEAPLKSKVEAPLKSKVEAQLKSKVEAPQKSKVEAPQKSKVVAPQKSKVETPQKSKKKAVVPKKPKVVNKKEKVESSAEIQVVKDIPDAVASIIGTIAKDARPKAPNEIPDDSDVKLEIVDPDNAKMDLDDCLDLANSETLSAPETQDMTEKQDDEPVSVIDEEEEVKLEKFDKDDDVKHEEVIDRIKEVIIKLEDGLNKPEPKAEEIEPEIIDPVTIEPKDDDDTKPVDSEPPREKIKIKIKKVKKARLLQEKKVKRQVEKVKSELEEMKKQMEEMRRQMSEELLKKEVQEMPESFLLPGEWCCKWVNGQPVGTVSEIEQDNIGETNSKSALPRRSVQVEDKRLPPGWTKHMVRRSFGSSAGKWDVVLMSPDNRRLHTKTDMRMYLENHPELEWKQYEHALTDFGIHLKLSRRMGWYSTTPDGEPTPPLIRVGTMCTTSPLVKRKKLNLNREKSKDRKKMRIKMKGHKGYRYRQKLPLVDGSLAGPSDEVPLDNFPENVDATPEQPPLEDGFVYVGSLKVQILENLLRCPADGCFKNFRNNTLLKMHIKHYHRELRKMLGATPKVLDLAYARTRPTHTEMRRLKFEAAHRTIKVKIPKLPRRLTEPKMEIKDETIEPKTEPIAAEGVKIPRSMDSPKLRIALLNKPVKRPKVLLPVRRPDQETEINEEDIKIEPKIEVPEIEPLDFETAISTHTVTKPLEAKRRGDKKKKFASISKKMTSEDEEWFAMNSDVETRSSFPRSCSPDSKADQKMVSSESNEEQKDNYMFTETGERIKLVHMKREEIINCHCGFREEDGLMVQCELCLCWQHALCHNIQKESEVPEKYTCSICLNPRRGRRSQRFLHDQDRLYEGLLPGAKPCESLRRSHELTGNLHRIEDALHALRVKYHVATKKDHPKLYLWAKDWEAAELSMTQERLNSDYSDLNIMISSLGKENLPVRDDKDLLDIKTPPSEEQDSDRYSQRDSQLGSQALLSGLLASPGGASLDLPISAAELERLARTVQAEAEARCFVAPQPEAAIENSACRERLLRHIQRCQALLDARLDSIEAQVAELESQDPSFEDDETADYFPRTKQTIQMMMRDLDTMEELGVIT